MTTADDERTSTPHTFSHALPPEGDPDASIR